MRFFKPSANREVYEFEWADALVDDDTISSFTVTADSGITLSSAATKVGGNVIRQVVEGGTHGSNYKITCSITTAASKIKTKDIFIFVRDSGAGANPAIGAGGSSL